VDKEDIADALHKAKELPPSMVEESINLEPVVQKLHEFMN
jgi:hypothetical protein